MYSSTTINGKRNRGKNFVDEEVMYLLNLVERHKRIIENKKTDGASNEQKTATWQLIQEQFNTMFPLNTRTADNLITKYDNMKRQAKKYAAERRKAEVSIDGGAGLLEESVISEKILDIINLKVDGVKCDYDRDNITVQNSNLHLVYDENNSEDITLPLVDEIPTIVKDELADSMGPTDQIPYKTLPEQQKIGTEVESEFVASTSQSRAEKFLETKERYYNLKIKYLEADMALKEQELKEKKEQENLKLELLKLQVEEQQLLVLEKRRRLQLE